MRGKWLILLFISISTFFGCANSPLIDEHERELNLDEAIDFGYAPFISCSNPEDKCIELPDVPYAWRFIPEFMGFRKFTPVGAIRKDWNDWWLSRKRGWWDWTNGIGDGEVSYGLSDGFYRPYALGRRGGDDFRYNYRRGIGNRHPGYPNWQRYGYGDDGY